MKPTDAQETAVIEAPFGTLILRSDTDDRVLTGIDLATTRSSWTEPRTHLLQEAARQFKAYFCDPRHGFDLPLALRGTAYRMRVWEALRRTAPGSVKTYGQLARDVRSGPRAVAGACRANDFPVIIPCHRVVSAHGLGGYCGQDSGPFLDIKRWLLRHEGYELPRDQCR